mmetsp:Transcript_8687/g.27701  ORF Transcript_8687/g.27701 Transcript_8687/m.27701 type:complete len:235 (-) Transcript_8687:653-1357(-)
MTRWAMARPACASSQANCCVKPRNSFTNVSTPRRSLRDIVLPLRRREVRWRRQCLTTATTRRRCTRTSWPSLGSPSPPRLCMWTRSTLHSCALRQLRSCVGLPTSRPSTFCRSRVAPLPTRSLPTALCSKSLSASDSPSGWKTLVFSLATLPWTAIGTRFLVCVCAPTTLRRWQPLRRRSVRRCSKSAPRLLNIRSTVSSIASSSIICLSSFLRPRESWPLNMPTLKGWNGWPW